MLPSIRPGTRILALALIGAGALLTLLIVVELSGIVDLARAAAGLAVLILPGLALGITRRPVTPLPRLNLLLAAAALGLACVAVAGLVLNVLPIGLSRTSWLGLVAGLLIATAVLARAGLPRLQREKVVLPRPGQAVAMAAAVVLVALALAIARAGVKQPSEPFSALWVVPAPAGMVEVGLDNREAGSTTYRVEVAADGVVDQTFPPVSLADGGRWTTLVTAPEAGGPRLEVLVYLASSPSVVYRRVTLSVGGDAEGAGAGPS